MLDSITEAVVSTDKEGLIVTMNTAAEKLSGYSFRNAVGKDISIVFEVVVPGEKNYLGNLVETVIRNGTTEKKSDHYILLTKGGTSRQVLFTIIPLMTGRGSIKGTVVVLTDITKRLETEAVLMREKSQMTALMENLPDHIYFKDLESRFTRNSLSHVLSFGFNDPEQIKGKSDFDFFKKEIAQQQYEDEQEIIRTGQTINKEEFTIRSDNSINWYHSTKMPLREKDGTIIGTFGMSRDITKRKDSEAELRKLSTAVEQSPVSIVITNLDGTIVYANPKTCQATGYSLEELLGQNPRVLKSGETSDGEYAFLWSSITSGKQWRGMFHNKKKNGELYWESSVIGPIKDSNGVITHFLAVKEDVTEYKLAEEEIKRKNEDLVRLNAEKDKFFSIIAHDLRSPFSTFMNLTKIMSEDIHEMSLGEIQQFATVINKSANTLFELLENLLEWSRMKRGVTEFYPVMLHLHTKIFRLLQVVTDFTKNKEITVNVDVPPELEIYADEQMIESTLRNLLSNAIKFTPRGGNVNISARHTPDNIVEISIRDTGIGMSQKILDKLFRIDENVSRKGTDGESSSGLGLLLCKEFVEKHGGEISVESEVDKGSVFHVRLPDKKLP